MNTEHLWKNLKKIIRSCKPLDDDYNQVIEADIEELKNIPQAFDVNHVLCMNAMIRIGDENTILVLTQITFIPFYCFFFFLYVIWYQFAYDII